MSMKNPLTPVGIEPATLRFVAQHLNPRFSVRSSYNYVTDKEEAFYQGRVL